MMSKIRSAAGFLGVLVLVSGLAAIAVAAQNKLPVGETGMEIQPWFHESTHDLRQDLANAQAAEKKLALVWEQAGCYYCKQMHEVTFSYPEIVDYVKENFYVIQMDMRGERQMTDFDGKKIVEKDLARRYRIVTTPSTVFYDAKAVEAYRMPGLADPPLFLALYHYVGSGGYRSATAGDWLRAKFHSSGETSDKKSVN